MKDKIDTLYNVLIPIGAYLGITQIESILGIIILSFQIILILYKGIYSIVMKVKNKNYKEIGNDISKTIEELEDLKGDNDNE